VKRERNRKERKARWIRAKNLMREYPDCAYNGDFYCDHLYDPAYPWVWVDFRFFHTKKKRYYAVAMRTLELEAYDDVEQAVLDEMSMEEIRSHPNVRALIEARLAPVTLRPKIELKDYGPVAVGMFATVNTPSIDENTIRQFIAFFRSQGEPVSAGWTWSGDEVQVDPRRFIQAP